MPSLANMPHIAIIGGGFAGTVAAIKLIDMVKGPFSLTILDPAQELGRGIAYSTLDHDHLVNGLAKLFGIHQDDPEHLVRWLVEHQTSWRWRPPAGRDWADSMPPRAIYGDYVVSEFAAARRRGQGRVRVTHLRERAVAVEKTAAGRRVIFASGHGIDADQIVLATGLFPRKLPFEAAGLDHGNGYIADPWSPGNFAGAAGARRILLLGASLTMLDSIITLEKQGFRGVYHAISRRGLLLPPRHDVTPWHDFLGEGPLPRTVPALLGAVQHERRAIAAAGEDWQRLVPAIRPHLSALWAGADTAERLRFTRHLRTFWDIALHRAAPESHVVLDRVAREGRFVTISGKILRLDAEGAGIAATYRRRGATEPETGRYDLVVNGLGHEFDWRRIDDPLVRQLLGAGLVRPHATGFGVDADPASKGVVDLDGKVSDWLFAVGHPLRGVSWESSSISEQVTGATELARSLAALLEQTLAVA